MKKLKNLTFACLLILGLAACADDNKSSNNPPIDNSETVTLEFTGEIGKENVNTITFTNPHAVEADLEVYINPTDSTIKIDTVSSTCDNIVNNYNSYNVTSKLAVGESCEIKYTYTPAGLDTALIKLNVDYFKSMATICPTPDTVPSYEQVMTRNKYVEMYIYNYAVDSNGNKSPEHINIEIPVEWSVTGSNAAYLNAVAHTQSFDLPAKQGEYSFYNPYGASLKSNNEDYCSILNNTLTVNGNNGCSLTVTATANYVESPIKFSPKQEGNPYYNVNVNINSNYTYNLLSAPPFTTFNPEYIAMDSNGDTYIYAGVLSNNEKITSYEITGTNKDKFKVAPTKHNGCTVTDTEISIPEEQNNCFYTIEITDISKTADYTAVLNTTLSTGATQNYNISGCKTVDLDYRELLSLSYSAKAVISLRSGLSEFLLQTNIPNITVYTKFRNRALYAFSPGNATVIPAGTGNSPRDGPPAGPPPRRRR